VLGEVIEHMEEPERVIRETMRILKRGAVLALSTPYKEAIEPGAVDAERHLWSLDKNDIIKLLSPYGSVRLATLGSQYFPRYVYNFPSIIAWCKKAI
jgi:SAM-dependent methyltransferase